MILRECLYLLLYGRKYKNDLSDILGILSEHEEKGKPISFKMIDNAVHDLYGNWDSIPNTSVQFIKSVMQNGNYKTVYLRIRKNEERLENRLETFKDKHNGILNERNVNSIIESEELSEDRESLIETIKNDISH